MVYRLRGIGPGKIGEPYNVRPHLGDQLLQKYRDQISCGWEDLERFELIDRLQKPVLWFHLYSHKKILLELFDLLDAAPYAFWIRPDKAEHIWKLPDDRRRRGACVYISRFPKLLRFIEKNKGVLSDDLWGLLHGYPLPEVHQFTYDHDAFQAKQGLDSDKMTEQPGKSREEDAAKPSRMRGITEWISVFQWE